MPIISILLLSIIASLGTGLGGLLVLIRPPGKRSFGFLMGMTAGVMISLSFLELVNEAWDIGGPWTATLGFGTGAMFMFLLDFYIPHIRFGEKEIHPPDAISISDQTDQHRHRYGHKQTQSQFVDRKLLNTGRLLAIGITLHNLPEGIAVGAGYMHTPQFGIFIAFAIMLHNIPEGIATALPLYQSGMSKGKAFMVALLSGLAEPVGAMLAALFLNAFRPLVPFSLALAGGVMMFITLDELIPTAREYGHQHTTAIGIITGSMFVFILSALFGI